MKEVMHHCNKCTFIFRFEPYVFYGNQPGWNGEIEFRDHIRKNGCTVALMFRDKGEFIRYFDEHKVCNTVMRLKEFGL